MHRSRVDLSRVSNEYAKGMALGHPTLSAQQGREIADAYTAAVHSPVDPIVAKAYDRFKDETVAQFFGAKLQGIHFDVWTRPGQPYKSSRDMLRDLYQRGHLYIFLGGDVPADHPMAETFNYRLDGVHRVNFNIIFRAVHDVFAHARGGHDFTARGEERAWVEHTQLYTPLARRAMTTETRGQNCWVNFGSHLYRPDGSLPRRGDHDYVHLTERPFPDQKAALLPEWVSDPAGHFEPVGLGAGTK